MNEMTDNSTVGYTTDDGRQIGNVHDDGDEEHHPAIWRCGGD